MTLEEMDKKIEFILEMQGQFEANVGKLAANLTRSEANMDNLKVSVADLRVSVAGLAGVVGESIKISDDRFSRFDEQMKDLATAQKVTGEQIKDLTAAQKVTDERLNALINIMEKHITGPDHPARP